MAAQRTPPDGVREVIWPDLEDLDDADADAGGPLPGQPPPGGWPQGSTTRRPRRPDQAGGASAEDRPAHLCEYCGLTFKRRFNLRQHIQTHYPDRPKVQCDVCQQAFYRQSDMLRHRRRHVPEGPERHVCGDCGREFYRADRLRSHRASGGCPDPAQAAARQNVERSFSFPGVGARGADLHHGGGAAVWPAPPGPPEHPAPVQHFPQTPVTTSVVTRFEVVFPGLGFAAPQPAWTGSDRTLSAFSTDSSRSVSTMETYPPAVRDTYRPPPEPDKPWGSFRPWAFQESDGAEAQQPQRRYDPEPDLELGLLPPHFRAGDASAFYGGVGKDSSSAAAAPVSHAGSWGFPSGASHSATAGHTYEHARSSSECRSTGVLDPQQKWP